MTINGLKSKDPNGLEIKSGEVYFLFILLSIFTSLLIEAFNLAGIPQAKMDGPGVTPQVVSIFSLIVLFIICIKSRKNLFYNNKISKVILFLFNRDVVAIISMVILYAILIEKLHFIPTSLLFLFITMILLNKRKPLMKLVISGISLFFIVLIFKYFFNVLLP